MMLNAQPKDHKRENSWKANRTEGKQINQITKSNGMSVFLIAKNKRQTMPTREDNLITIIN